MPAAAPPTPQPPAPQSPTPQDVRRAFAELRPLAPAIRRIWTLKMALSLLVPLAAVGLYDLVGLFGGGEGRWLPPGTLTGLLVVLGGAACVGLPRLRYRYWRFALRPEELYLERGVFNRVRTIVPLRRIQHLDVSQDLFEREYGLGKLIVHTAGSRSSNVVVPGLRYEEAERLRDDVKRYVLDDTL